MIRPLFLSWSGLLLACAVDRPDASAANPTLCVIAEHGAVSGVDPWPCQHLVDRFATLLTQSPRAGAFETGDEAVFTMSRGPAHSWRFVFDIGSRWDASTPERQREFRANTGLHEVGHMWLDPEFEGIAHADTFRTKYGTPAPDWFDEAWAVWAEAVAPRQQRFDQFRSDATPSLATLVTMRHPVQAQNDAKQASPRTTAGSTTYETVVIDPCSGNCDYLPDSLRGKVMSRTITRAPDGRVDTTTIWTDRATSAAAQAAAQQSVEAEHFYPLSYSLLRYIRETGGEAAVRELIARYRADTTPRVDALAGLPGLPAGIDALEQGWLAFLAERRPEPR